MYLVNFTRFHVGDRHAQRLLSARREWSLERAGGDRFRGGLLVALDGEEWLDVAIWERGEQSQRGEQSPGASPCASAESEFLDRLDGSRVEILGLETGDLVFADPMRCHPVPHQP